MGGTADELAYIHHRFSEIVPALNEGKYRLEMESVPASGCILALAMPSPPCRRLASKLAAAGTRRRAWRRYVSGNEGQRSPRSRAKVVHCNAATSIGAFVEFL